MLGMGRSVWGADQWAVGRGPPWRAGRGRPGRTPRPGPLTGRTDGPGLGPPPGLIPGVHAFAESIGRHSSRIGRAVDLDPLELWPSGPGRWAGPPWVGELRRIDASPPRPRRLDGGEPSPPHGLGTGAGLARALHRDGRRGLGPGDAVRGRVFGRRAPDRSAGLGLAVARVGERRRRPPATGRSADDTAGVVCRRLGGIARPPADIGDLVVVDLSALWAGPLVGAVLVRVGARVVKVESTTRPDGDGWARPCTSPRSTSARSRSRST